MIRQPQELKVRPGAQKSSSTSIPAPIGGLNARDSVANMKPQDAIILENWEPKTTSVDVRRGFTAWNTFTGVPHTIFGYTALTAKTFVAVKSGSTYSIYDGTSSGALSSAVVGGSGDTVQEVTSARFDYANFGTSGGQFISAVNGADTPLQYDGTSWTASAVSGGTPADFFTVAVYQRRLWYGVKNSLRVRYQPTDTIAGATTGLELGSLFKLGGTLNSIITLTDSSDTLSDYIGFLTTEGEILAFTGYDPADPTTWRLAAHFRIGKPVTKGNRCWTKWGTDALVLCGDGVYPLRSAITEYERRGSGLAVSDKIRNLINSDIAIHGGRQGWTLNVHPNGAKLFVNVPTAEDVSAYQYVMNTQTGAWSKFTGWNATIFEVQGTTLWMGLPGKMVKADAGADDAGIAINTASKQAFNYFGSRGSSKHMKMVRPILAVNGQFSIGIDVDVDYDDSPPTSMRTISGGSGDPWGGVWDATWSGAMNRTIGWYSVRGIGHCIAPRINTQTEGVTLTWSATDIVFENGGIL